MNVEHGTFTPLVFSLTGSEIPEAFLFHKHVAQKIFANTEENYDRVLSLIRCKFSFLILRSVLICVGRSRLVGNDHVHLDDVSLTGQAAGFFLVFVDLVIELFKLLFVKTHYLLPTCNIGFVLFNHLSLICIFFPLPYLNGHVNLPQLTKFLPRGFL